MHRRTQFRIAVLVLTLLAAGAIVLVASRLRPEVGSTRLVEVDVDEIREEARRSLERSRFDAHDRERSDGAGSRHTRGRALPPKTTAMPLRPLEERFARALFPQLETAANKYRYDPYRLVALAPGFESRMRFGEYPGGSYSFSTNNLGFRDDDPTSPGKPPGVFRILVAGDSHIEGVVPNAENFAQHLEAMLDARCGPFESLNAGVGGTGPYNYLGTLRSSLDLEPDLFLPVIYCGNDFLDALLLDMFLRAEAPRKPPAEDQERIQRAAARRRGYFPQALVQAHRFHHFPEERERALGVIAGLAGQMQALAREHGVRLLVAVLPTKLELAPDTGARYLRMLDAIGLEPDAPQINARLREDLVTRLRRDSIEVLDPTEALRASTDPVFWEWDHHLSLRGHRILAEQALAALAPDLCPDEPTIAPGTPHPRKP